MGGEKRPYGNARLYRDTLKRVKLIASATDRTIADVLDPIVRPALGRLEKGVMARFRSAEKSARVPAK
jgi:hypothetical protein